MFRKETRLGPAQRRAGSRKGVVLVIVVVVAIIFAIVGFGVLGLAQHEITLTRIETDKAKALYIAESGLAKLSEMLQQPVVGDIDDVIGDALENETVEQGSFGVELDTSHTPCYAISTGTSGTVQRKIRVQVNFLAAPFEHAIFAMNASGGAWGLQLRGRGVPDWRERGGRDAVNGNIFVDGDTFLYEESSVNPAPAPNKWNLNGDVGATGNISVLDSASVAGATNPRATEPPPVDLTTMNYAVNNTHNVAQIFQSAGVSSGHLPLGSPLRDVFEKNPSDRSAECGSTSGDDYFLEPSTGFILGDEKEGETPLHAGTDRVYYVDGDVWVHSKSTYGFKMDGKVTIVATGDIHICDNIEYKDKTKDLLGLVALGKYDGSGTLTSGGDIFFGDPRYGTMYTIAGLMFAASDFLYNTYPVDRRTAEPTSGFTVNGSFAAMNQVVIERDWYTKSGSGAKPARYDSATSRWVDCATGTALTASEKTSLRHYRMIVNYDDRVRSVETQPPGLPRGGASIFAGFSNWEEL